MSDTEGTSVPEKTFDDPKEEAAHWKTLALTFQQYNRRLSADSQSGKAANLKMKEEVAELRNRLESLTSSLENPSTAVKPGSSKMTSEDVQPGSSSTMMTSQGAQSVRTSASSLVSLDTIPKLTFFNGKDGANDYPYASWRFDVNQLIQSGYPARGVRLAIVRSCRGDPATVLQSLGEDFLPETVISAFDNRFASVTTAESILAQFYSATQQGDENVNTWGCRLEGLLTNPQMRYLSVQQREDMLRGRFWRGLKPESRNALRHKVDSGASYEQLLVFAREVESESCESSATGTSRTEKSAKSSKKAAIASAQLTDPSSLASQLQDLQARLIAIEKRLPPASGSQPRQQGGRGRGRGRGNGRSQAQGQEKSQASEDKKTSSGKKKLICYECGEEGHYRNRCPTLAGKTQVKGE